MRLLLDTDILLDVALDRSPHAEPAARLLDALEGRPGRAFIAWHSAANFYYLVSPLRGKGDARAFLAELTRFVDVAPATTAGLRLAAGLPMKDFEDAIQVAAALACGADAIATRNVRDYARGPVRAATPKALLEEVNR